MTDKKITIKDIAKLADVSAGTVDRVLHNRGKVSESNRKQVYKRLYPNLGFRTVCKLKVGDKVRKLIKKDIYEKGYTKNWSEELYIIVKVKQSNGVCYYYLESLDHTAIPGIFYYYQLNLVSRHADSSGRTD